MLEFALLVVPLRNGPAPELPPLARRLWDEREARGITQAEAVRVLDVPQATYAGWETGRSTPGVHCFATLAAFIGVGERDVATLCATPFIVASWVCARPTSPSSRARPRQRWVQGHSRPMPTNLRRLAVVLKMPYAQVVDAAGRAA